jgi:hypothetical protein
MRSKSPDYQGDAGGIAPSSFILRGKSIQYLPKPMETLNIKAEARSLIDKLPENLTGCDLIPAIYLRQTMKSEPIRVKGIKQGKTIELL